MATIKMSGIGITELSGKFGGTVGARGKAGMTARNRVKGTNARTNSQILQRARFSNNSSGWRDLTAAERRAWTLAASSGEWPQTNRLGETFQPTGSGLYNLLNDTLVSIGATVITVPPLKVAFTQIVLGALTAAAAVPALSLVFTGVLAADESLIVFATFGMSPGVQRPTNWRKITTYAGVTPANLLATYALVFGNPIEGTQIFIRAEIVSETTGQRQLVGQVSAIVAA